MLLKDKLITIIVVTYNVKYKLPVLLNSIVSQKTDEIELVLIDGNSTDGTKEIIKEYSRVIDYYLSEKDKGIYDAMNKGIINSHGEWLFFLGADDILVENAIENLLPIIKNYKEYLIISNYYENTNGNLMLIKQKPFNYKFQLLKGCINHQSVLINKYIFEKFGLYDLNFRLASDYEFYLRIPFYYLKHAYKTEYSFTYYNTSGVSSINLNEVYNERSIIIHKHFGKIIGFIYNIYLKYVSKNYSSSTRL
jgi:glycosyltransferase involved in cell wall biosynthesis